MHFAQKFILQLLFSLRLALNSFLISLQISGSSSYKFVLIKNKCNYINFHYIHYVIICLFLPYTLLELFIDRGTTISLCICFTNTLSET